MEGASEYIETPYTIKCELHKLPKDDFLIQSRYALGKPNMEQLMEFMEDAYNKKLRYMDHQKHVC